MRVDFLLNQTYSGMSGLTRYEQNLLTSLAEFPTLQIRQVAIGLPPFIQLFAGTAARIGLDLSTFFQSYPLYWPDGLAEVVHLTRLGQATLLYRRRAQSVILTVHDIIHYMYRGEPDLHIYQHPIQAWFDALAVRFIKRADVVIASSNYTRRCLVKYADVPDEKIRQIYPGIDLDQFRPLEIPEEFFQRYGLSQDVPYVLHVSTEEPRKNFPAVLRAFAGVAAEDREVILLKIGRPLYPAQRQRHLDMIKEIGIRDRVIFVDNVPDADLAYFYNAARLFLFPSSEEGFGFPILEAMACGTPVICSRVSSLPELGGEAVCYVDPSDPNEITQAISKLLSDRELHNNLKTKGFDQSIKFALQKTAMQTLSVYQFARESHNA